MVERLVSERLRSLYRRDPPRLHCRTTRRGGSLLCWVLAVRGAAVSGTAPSPPAGNETLGGRKLSFLAGSDPSVASNLVAAVPLTSSGAGADSTLALASTRCPSTRSSGGHGATAPQPPCPRRLGPPPYPDAGPSP